MRPEVKNDKISTYSSMSSSGKYCNCCDGRFRRIEQGADLPASQAVRRSYIAGDIAYRLQGFLFDQIEYSIKLDLDPFLGRGLFA